MGGLSQFWQEPDAVGRTVALVLLAMSVCAWVLILWKGAVLHRARRQLPPAVRAFWAAESLDSGRQRLQALDAAGVLLPLVAAAAIPDAPGTLATQAEPGSQLTRRLRDALHAVVHQLQYGQVVLASIGSTAPFIGLLGTVWGIYHALASIAASGSAGASSGAGTAGRGSAWIAARARAIAGRSCGRRAGRPSIASTTKAPNGSASPGGSTASRRGTWPEGAARRKHAAW